MNAAKKMYIIGDKKFTSQKAAQECVRQILTDIGICDSVKQISIEKYELLLQIAKNHHKSDEKLRNISDFLYFS